MRRLITKATRTKLKSKSKSKFKSKKRVRSKMLTWWEVAERCIEAGERTILIYGPPGTGKTTFACKHGLKTGSLVEKLTLNEGYTATMARGCYKIKDGNMVWEDGPVLRAWRHGRRLVFDEITSAGGDVLTYLLGALDAPEIAQDILPNGELVRPSDKFTVIATCNEPPDRLPPAMSDRFRVRILADEPHPDLLKRLPQKYHSPCINACKQTGERFISPRQWLAYNDLHKVLGPDDAARMIFGNRAKDITNALAMV